MRTWTSALYWMATGAVLGFGLIRLMSIGFPFLLIGALMAACGIVKWGAKGSWAALVGFGGVPALFLITSLSGRVLESNWSCSRISFDKNEAYGTGTISASGEVVSTTCSTIPGQLFVLAGFFLTIALLGLSLRFLTYRRHTVT